MILRLPIDTKSLYFNISNDNQTGHTPTVATPLKQGASIHTELAQIIRIPENVNPISRENIISQILSKSRVAAKITRVFLFDKVSVNGHVLPDLPKFCIYIREETDKSNVHCGRQKVHYPYSLSFSDLEVEVSNRAVLDAVSDYLHGYAFLVEAFEYCTETQVLNLDVTIVGKHNVPYSKVFVNKRGVGNKFSEDFFNYSDSYDSEIIALREKLGYGVVGPENYSNVILKNDGIACNLASEYLQSNGASSVRNLKREYPYALFDLEYIVDGIKKYVIVKQTATNNRYFSLPFSQVQFCNEFQNCVSLILYTDINGTPIQHMYSVAELNGMSKTINSITYRDGG